MPIVHIYIKDKIQMLEGFFCNVQGFITDVEFVIQKGEVRWKEIFPLSPFVLCFVLFLQLKCYISNPTQWVTQHQPVSLFQIALPLV